MSPSSSAVAATHSFCHVITWKHSW